MPSPTADRPSPEAPRRPRRTIGGLMVIVAIAAVVLAAYQAKSKYPLQEAWVFLFAAAIAYPAVASAIRIKKSHEIPEDRDFEPIHPNAEPLPPPADRILERITPAMEALGFRCLGTLRTVRERPSSVSYVTLFEEPAGFAYKAAHAHKVGRLPIKSISVLA